MKGMKLTGRDTALLVVLLIIILGVVYYMAFYTPLQSELTRIDNQCVELDSQIVVAEKKVASMNKMQQELDEIFTRPESEITEIAPYDNAKLVMNFLNGVLAASSEYQLSFADPAIEESGTVRRNVNLSFSCEDYATAKSILKNLASWNYRCLLGNVTVSAREEFIAEGGLSISATMTFFESTNLS